MTREFAIGLVIAFMGIIGGMAIVHHHEDQDREKEIFQQQFETRRQDPSEINPPYNQQPEGYYRPRSCNERMLLKLHNEMRCSPLYGRTTEFTLDRSLCERARRHAEHCARNGKEMNYRGRYNCSQRKGPNNEVSVFQDWMWTPRNQEYITGNYFTRVGFGSAYDRDGQIYWCAIYR